MAAAGGVLFCTANFEEPRSESSGNGYLYALDLKTKKILWKHRVNRQSPHKAVSQWGTRVFLPADDAVFYENESILVKIR